MTSSRKIRVRIAATCKAVGMNEEETTALAEMSAYAGVTPEVAGYAIPEIIMAYAIESDPWEVTSLRVHSVLVRFMELPLTVNGTSIQFPFLSWLQYVVRFALHRQAHNST